MRATDRVGELLKAIPPATGRNQHSEDGAGADTELPGIEIAPPQKGRFEAAEAAGLSKRQAVTAIRVNNVPREDFERQVDDPPAAEAVKDGRGKTNPSLGEEFNPTLLSYARTVLAYSQELADAVLTDREKLDAGL